LLTVRAACSTSMTLQVFAGADNAGGSRPSFIVIISLKKLPVGLES
jgi:hypothetical protein